MIHDSLKENKNDEPLVSVIIPVYNTENYLKVCLDSVLNQTYNNFEVICIDDGSTDRSAEIIRRVMIEDNRIYLYQIENGGQGKARNYALTLAKGEYIFFMDSDDYIENITLDLAVARAEEDKSDLVVFDWRFYEPIGKATKYDNIDKFFCERVLYGEMCYRLLELSTFFTVNKMYRKSFLDGNNICYGEGFLYEDVPFWVDVVLSAKKVSLIHSPLYRVTTHNTSSTKTAHDTNRHYVSFIQAIKTSIEIINRKAPELEDKYVYVISKYFLQRFLYYYNTRTPKEYKFYFAKDFVDLFSYFCCTDYGESKFLTICYHENVFTRKKYKLFQILIFLSVKVKPFLKLFGNTVKDKIKKFGKKNAKKFPRIAKKIKAATSQYDKYIKQSLYEDVILFMGFDHRYTGNSRYLFEEMLQRNYGNKKVFFATDNSLVPIEYRIQPHTDRCDRFIARSKVIIYESWIPLNYVKRSGQRWIQLWHGTPLKKMLFDSNEKDIYENNGKHKLNKFNDIQRWDYFLLDNPNIASYFQTAFLINNDKMLNYGYPRVKYLLEKSKNSDYIDGLKRIYEIPLDKKVVLYLPTWRDYNYQQAEAFFDLDYLLNLQELQEKLGDGYVIVYKDHSYLSKPEKIAFKNYGFAETQELLLVADYLITDYSSVMFDAFAIEKPVLLYCTDIEKNEESRGLYLSLWNKVKRYNNLNVDSLIAMMKEYVIDDYYMSIKNQYCYRNKEEKYLSDFILGLIR